MKYDETIDQLDGVLDTQVDNAFKAVYAIFQYKEANDLSIKADREVLKENARAILDAIATYETVKDWQEGLIEDRAEIFENPSHAKGCNTDDCKC